ncbi:BPSS1780 family membrane protein [Uliginosibacterium sp. 31-16]|uniref:BPSS1780 family membrane protein n=1 Tax=Uliginosibacterium sp. 31-16 TaxID=3068315 RepID=UPI00273E1AF2|nr:BPSS1780 family membrane protein [Uliginosibacterium sp. 31-16]MDP5239084.1 BPSS1780 family membrane protein [Uliginosibacterium sp. 31-16]
MQANAFPALHGWVWLQAGFALWRSTPLPLTGSAMTMMMCLLLSALLIPGIGPLLAIALVLPLQVGMFLVCSSCAQQRRAHPKLLFACFTKARLPGLFALTGLSFAAILVCFMLATALTGFDFGSFASIAAKGTELPVEMQDKLRKLVWWASLLFVPIQMTTFFAAPLIALKNTPLIKALFFSCVACWRNLRPMLVMLLSFFVLGNLLPALLLGVISQLSASFAGMLSGVWMMMMFPVLCATLYSCARDIFGEWPIA